MNESTYKSFYHLLFNQAKFGIMIINFKGHILDVNPFICSLLEFTNEELLCLTIYNLLNPEELQKEPPAIDLTAKGETVVKERRILKKSGKYVLVELHVQKLEQDRVLMLVHDISLRDSALQTSEENYRRIVETALEGIWQMDAGHVTTFVNKRMTEMLGYTEAEMVGHTVEYFMFPEDIPDHEQKIENRRQGKGDFYERRFRCKNGDVCWTRVAATSLKDENDIFTGSFALCTEISDQKRFEENLINSEERLQTLINSSPDIICFKDAEGRWMQVNDSILELYGLSGVAYSGKTEFELAEYTSPIFHDAFRNCKGSDDLAWENGISTRIVENIPDTTGNMHIFDVVKVPLFHPDGSRKGILVFGRDITDIKQTESALRASEEKYRQIAEQTSDVIWMMNTQMHYTYVSPSIYRQRGFTPEEFINLNTEEIYTPESLKKVIDIFTMGVTMAKQGKVPPGYSVTAELRHLCKDGSVRDSEVLISPVFDSGGNLTGGHGVSRDITFRKNAEKTNRLLTEFQSRLLKINELTEVHELVVNTVSDLIGEGIVFTTNIDEHAGTGRIISFKGLDIPRNQLTQAFGLDPFEMNFNLKDITDEELRLYKSGKFEELPGGLFALATRRFPKLITQGVEQLLKIKKIYTIGFVYHELHMGGFMILSHVDLSARAGTIELIVNQAAISLNRIKAEARLKEVEERFRLAFQTSPDAVNINEMETGRYIEVNEGFSSITGYAREDVIGKTAFEINVWANPESRTGMVEILKREGKVINYEALFRFKNGTMHTGLMSAAIINLNGVPHIISISRDIEILKQAERDLFRAKEAAEEASRLKTAFLNNISHEVRTPMNAILGFTDLLQSDDIEQTEKSRFFGIINSNARQLLSIIDDVLEISRMDSGRIPLNPVVFSIHELMEDIRLSMHDMVSKTGLAFHYDCEDPGGQDRIIADREKIRQVITGLIGNAIKFTHSGGISFGYTRNDGLIEFYVRDTGIGIARAEQEKIFDRFYQVNHETFQGVRGTGLGLSIAAGLAEVMNGSMRVESSPGSGSVLFLTIPYEVPFSTGIPDEKEKSFSMAAMTILVAEDEDYNYELLEILLSKKAKKIIRAYNGAEVINLLEIQKPDLILMDLKMPVMDGYEATLRAKEIYPDLHIIALTAYTQPEEERRAMDAGCSAFISKPIRNQDLIETIKRSIRN